MIEEKHWKKLWSEVYHVLNPEVPIEQVNPHSFTYASSRRRVDEIIILFRDFNIKQEVK